MSRRGPARLAGGAYPEPRYQALVGEAVGAMQAGDDVRAERAARALLRQQADRSWDNALTRLAEDLQAI